LGGSIETFLIDSGPECEREDHCGETTREGEPGRSLEPCPPGKRSTGFGCVGPLQSLQQLPTHGGIGQQFFQRLFIRQGVE
jgi:hypothetical protein